MLPSRGAAHEGHSAFCVGVRVFRPVLRGCPRFVSAIPVIVGRVGRETGHRGALHGIVKLYLAEILAGACLLCNKLCWLGLSQVVTDSPIAEIVMLPPTGNCNGYSIGE